ncbi:MAG: RNA-binding S4 domain-containing protein [Gammaproteobacteria bacterium]
MSNREELSSDTMRLDKWLWCARFFKTRSQAADAIKAGMVQVNGYKVKPSRSIKPGEALRIRRGLYHYHLTVVSLARSRKSAVDAALLYVEGEESIAKRALTEAQLRIADTMSPRTKGRPTKRERRQLTKFRKGAS